VIIRKLGRRTILQVQGTLLSCTRGNTLSIRRIVFQIHGLLWNIRNSNMIGEISFNLMIDMGRLVRLILKVRLLIILLKFFNDRIAAIITVLSTANKDFTTLTTLFLTFKY
jgi:hypothetical protein